MDIETVPISDLHGSPSNPRKNDDAVDHVAASLNRFGWQQPVVARRSGEIIAGNTRYKAAKSLGMTEIPVVWFDGESIDATAYAIADNRTAEFAEWDNPGLAALLDELRNEDALEGVGYDSDAIDRLIEDVARDQGQVEEDDGGGPPPDDPISKPGDLWICGSHKVLCGDSTNADDVVRLMAGERADCVFTSPPYAVGVDYGETYSDTIDALREMLPKLSALWIDVVAAGGFAVVNFSDIASGRDIAEAEGPCEYPMALEYWPAFRPAWALWSRRAWCKPNARVNAMWCIGSNRAATDWEHVWTFKAPGVAVVARVDGEMRSPLGWFDTTSMHGVDMGKDEHGAGMPVGAAAWMLNVHSKPGGIVHEPFCGTGTTLIAAHQLGRKCYAIEISPAYVDVAIRRWEKASGLTAHLSGSDRMTFDEIAADRST